MNPLLLQVHEETNVPKSELATPLLLGAMEDAHRKPDLLFLVETRLDAAAVRAAYAAGAAEGWESDRIAFRPAATLAACEDLPLASVTRACAACYAASCTNTGL